MTKPGFPVVIWSPLASKNIVPVSPIVADGQLDGGMKSYAAL